MRDSATAPGRQVATEAKVEPAPAVAPGSARSRAHSPFPEWMARSAGEHLPLALLTGVYVAAALVIQAVWGLDLTRELGWKSLLIGAVFGAYITAIGVGSLLCVFLVSRAVGWLARRVGRRSPFRSQWADYRRHLAPERLAGFFVVFFLYVPLMNVFVGFKSAIPAIQPFAWDVAFMRLDRALHLGYDPWVLLQPIVGTPRVTAALDSVYYLWFPIKMLVLVWIAWSPRRELRNQFLLAFFALWILLGTVAATAFSSAGPCYYGLVVGGADPYAPLMEYLRRVDMTHPLTALDVQAMLWSGHTGATRLIEGIAAMPSLHVAIPLLWVIAGWRIDRRLGIAFAVYAVLILIGSVHLAWHYAIDGYVTLLAVPLVWWAAGKASRAYEVWSAARVGSLAARSPGFASTR